MKLPAQPPPLSLVSIDDDLKRAKDRHEAIAGNGRKSENAGYDAHHHVERVQLAENGWKIHNYTNTPSEIALLRDVSRSKFFLDSTFSHLAENIPRLPHQSFCSAPSLGWGGRWSSGDFLPLQSKYKSLVLIREFKYGCYCCGSPFTIKSCSIVFVCMSCLFRSLTSGRGLLWITCMPTH